MEPEKPGQRAVDRSAADGKQRVREESPAEGEHLVPLGEVEAAETLAHEHHEAALETARDLESQEQEAERLLDQALELYEEWGDEYDTVTCRLELLVEHCRDRGEDDQAAEWFRRACDALEGAPDPVAKRHREWVGRHCPT